MNLPMSLLQIAFIFFALIAAGGLLMAGLIAGKIGIPPWLGPVHGLGALAALGVLLAAVLKTPDAPQHAWWALYVFGAGFTGGVFLFRVLFRNRVPMLAMVAAHGSLGAIGLYLLYGAAF